MELPLIDEHSVGVAASPAHTWAALVERPGEGRARSAPSRIARLLGCEQTGYSGRPGEVGSTSPGFRVVRASPPRELALEGAHRFSRYSLVFRIEGAAGGPSLLRAETRAAFPGVAGQLYKTAVIRSRGHVLATRRMLQAIARRAEGGEAANVA